MFYSPSSHLKCHAVPIAGSRTQNYPLPSGYGSHITPKSNILNTVLISAFCGDKQAFDYWSKICKAIWCMKLSSFI